MVKIIQLIPCLKFILNHPLTRSNRLVALLRFLRWQIGSRLLKEDIIIPYVDGTLLRVRPGMTGATGNLYVGLDEFDDMAFLLHLLREDDLFLDIGANIGSYTVLAGGAVGAKCMSFEPIPTTFGCLKDNITLNNLSERVQAFNIGVGKEKGCLRFTCGMDSLNHVVTNTDNNVDTVEVEVQSLNQLVKHSVPSLMKIDVEGFETNVIAGASDLLSKDALNAVIMELNGSGTRYGFDETELHRHMLNCGFNTFRYSPFERELIPLHGKNNTFGNTLYVKNVDKVKSLLKESRDYFIVNVATTV